MDSLNFYKVHFFYLSNNRTKKQRPSRKTCRAAYYSSQFWLFDLDRFKALDQIIKLLDLRQERL